MRISVRLDEDTQKKIDSLIEHYQKDSISKVTVADVIRKAVDNLYDSQVINK